MIRIETLRYLDEVARTNSIRKAAERLFISKSALSSALKNLEKELGVVLLERSVYGVELTEAGKMVLEKANIIFEMVDQMNAESWLYKHDAETQSISYYMNNSFAGNIFPELLQYFQRIMGKTKMQVFAKETLEEIVDGIRNDEIAMGFYISNKTTLENLINLEDVIVEKIETYKQYCVAAKYSKYIPKNLQLMSLDELKRIPQIGFMGDRSIESMNTNQPDYYDGGNVVFYTNNSRVYRQAIENDIGVGIMPWLGLVMDFSHRDAFQCIPIENIAESHLYFFANKQCPHEIYMKHEEILQRALAEK